MLEEGSTDQALRGAHHNRGICCYMLLYEALSRLLLQTTDIALPSKFKDELFTIKDVKGKTKEDRKLALDSILNDQEFHSFLKNVTTEIKLHSSEMSQYWLSCLEMVEILLMNYHALHAQNWKDYLRSLKLMLPWMAIYDSLHNTRYMSIYWAEMNNLNEDIKKYMDEGLCSQLCQASLSRLFHMNKASKMKGGWKGFTKNESIVNIHTHTVNSMMKVREALHKRASISNAKRDHAANSKSRMKTDEQRVQGIANSKSRMKTDEQRVQDIANSKSRM